MQQGTLSLYNIIEQVSNEKGIDPKVLIEATEQAILTAAKRTFGANRELEARFNEETGWVDLFQYMIVTDQVDNDEREISVDAAKRHGLEAVPGEELGFQIFYRPEDADRARQQDKEFGDLLHLKQHRQGFGRIAAQTAKQVIIQRVRDAERERIFNEFKDRKGEIITGVVRRFERGSNLIVDLGRGIEAVLPPREQTPRESYRPGDRIVAFLKEIDREARGPQIILSRTDVGLLVKLFEMEVPEIYEGIVRIVAAAREPGARSKIAVSSRDSDVDPVGACVGMKGSRVQAVVQELRGEKIDIVPFDRDPARFVCNAIAPAEVVRVVIDEAHATMELVVPDAKLSLAIGRRGQNVRLASQLCGWKLDIVSESRFKQMEEESLRHLARIRATDEDDELAKALYRMGFRTLDEVAEAPEQELTGVEGITADQVPEVRRKAIEGMEHVRLERLRELAEQAEMPSEHDRLRLVGGLTERMVEMLEQGGYGNVDMIASEQDTDKLALRTGLGMERAHQVKDAVAEFLAKDWPPVAEGIKKHSEAQAEAEAAQKAREEAESRARREAEQQKASDAAAQAEAETGSGGDSESDVSPSGAPGDEAARVERTETGEEPAT
ncbi:MAG: transcription termination factor NusA [Myxococcota bacterium]